MATAPNSGDTSGTPISLNLPFVSEGDPIKASDINNLSAAIERMTLGMGSGYEINNAGRRSSMTIEDQTAHYRAPWACQRNHQKMMITIRWQV